MLTEVTCIRDHGILLNCNFNFSEHCSKIAVKAYYTAHQVLNCFHSNDICIFLKAYKVYVRPILEYCTPVWSPFLSKDIIVIEKVQKYFIQKICRKCNTQYTDYKS